MKFNFFWKNKIKIGGSHIFMVCRGCLAIAFGTKKSLLFGFEALFALLFLPFLNCWTASLDSLCIQRKNARYKRDEIRHAFDEKTFARGRNILRTDM